MITSKVSLTAFPPGHPVRTWLGAVAGRGQPWPGRPEPYHGRAATAMHHPGRVTSRGAWAGLSGPDKVDTSKWVTHTFGSDFHLIVTTESVRVPWRRARLGSGGR